MKRLVWRLIMFNLNQEGLQYVQKWGSQGIHCLEGRSWRKDVYEPTKERKVVADKRLLREQEEDTDEWEAYDDFI